MAILNTLHAKLNNILVFRGLPWAAVYRVSNIVHHHLAVLSVHQGGKVIMRHMLMNGFSPTPRKKYLPNGLRFRVVVVYL